MRWRGIEEEEGEEDATSVGEEVGTAGAELGLCVLFAECEKDLIDSPYVLSVERTAIGPFDRRSRSELTFPCVRRWNISANINNLAQL